jgi:hypothetical protein
MESAPTDGTPIIGLYDDGEEDIFWSERPVCMAGPVNGGHPEGWATCGDHTDHNLPMEKPNKWREQD